MKANRLHKHFVFGASVCLLAACSGAGNEDLFAAEGQSSFTDRTEPAPGGSSQLPGSSSGATSSSGSSGTTSSGSSSGGSSSGSSSGGSSSGSSSGGSSSGGSSSGGVVTPEIFCGTEAGNPRICTGGATCCAKRSANGALQFACVPPTGGGGAGLCTGAVIRCDSGADCGGQLCCGAFEQTFGYKSVQCQPQCVTQVPGVTMVQMCDPAAAVDECAAAGKQCKPSGSLIGFHICK